MNIVNGLNYCFRVVYHDGTSELCAGVVRSPKLLSSYFDTWSIDGREFPKCDSYNDIVSLFYERAAEFDFEKDRISEVQIYNKATKEVVYSKHF